MSEKQTILNLIENADPANSDKLDEIDTAVHHFLYGPDAAHTSIKPVTRSRDALKAIRPKGFLVKIENWQKFTSVYGCFILESGKVINFESGQGTTEELAELHVIIQGISYLKGQHS